MAQLFKNIFGDMIATENTCSGNTLPSPEQLKHKVILKGNLRVKKKVRILLFSQQVATKIVENALWRSVFLCI